MPEKYQPVRITPNEENLWIEDDKYIPIFKVDISTDEYEVCEQAATNMWANKKNGEWGRGLINTADDRYRVERIGRLGEMAFSKITGLEMDLEYRQYGDKGDFNAGGMTIDVKTANKLYSYKSGLVRAIDDRGNKIAVTNDIYVFSFINSEERENKTASVTLVGWEQKEELEKLPLSPAKRGNHKNYEILYVDLKPMSELVTLLAQLPLPIENCS